MAPKKLPPMSNRSGAVGGDDDDDCNDGDDDRRHSPIGDDQNSNVRSGRPPSPSVREDGEGDIAAAVRRNRDVDDGCEEERHGSLTTSSGMKGRNADDKRAADGPASKLHPKPMPPPSSPGLDATASTCSVSTVGSSAVLASTVPPTMLLSQPPIGTESRQLQQTGGSERHRPPRSRRRRRGRDGGRGRNRRDLLLLERQLTLLATTVGISLLLFLFFYLPFLALVALSLFATTTALLLHATYRYGEAWVRDVSSRPGGLLRFAPETVRVMLTETTLHEWMMDPSFYLEYRYLLLYFVPGLEPEQLEAMVDRLPPRHRDMLRGRGLGRLILGEDAMRTLSGPPPTVIEEGEDEESSVDVDAADGVAEGDRARRGMPPLLLEYEGGGEGRDDNVGGDDDEGREGEEDVTTQEALRDLAGTALGFLRAAAPAPVLAVVPSTDLVWLDEGDRRDSSAGDGPPATVTATISSRSMTEGGGRRARVDSSSTSTSSSSSSSAIVATRELARQQEEIAVEDVVLSDAASTMMSNYMASAVTSVVDAVESAVDWASPYVVRFGFGASAASALGLMGSWYLRVARGGEARSAGGVRSRGLFWPWPSGDYLAMGLATTAFGGVAAASLMVFVRNRVRAAAVESRRDAAARRGMSIGGIDGFKDQEPSGRNAKGKDDQ